VSDGEGLKGEVERRDVEGRGSRVECQRGKAKSLKAKG
jgi:hypothetical protein